MPGLIPLIKQFRPDLPIVYRSHIEIRSDLVRIKGSPQEEVWKYLWNNIQLADLFISKWIMPLSIITTNRSKAIP
jgi:alpha,alpha-trehalose phosphorylase (configuration-retaining)